jgi:hypothetical protein
VLGRRGVEVGKQIIERQEAEHRIEGGGAVRAVVDGLVHVGEADFREAGCHQDAFRDGRVGE